MPERKTITAERHERTCDVCGVSETTDVTGEDMRGGKDRGEWRSLVIGAADHVDQRLILVHGRACAVAAFTKLVDRLYPADAVVPVEPAKTR